MYIVILVVLEMSEEQRQQILNSQDFSFFFEKATRVLEKALGDNSDVCFDYGGFGEEIEG